MAIVSPRVRSPVFEAGYAELERRTGDARGRLEALLNGIRR
ncbi:hypothetical protein [Arthrobacter mobilis]|nr:hypothetical protein [Arthrobacter mobilis]